MRRASEWGGAGREGEPERARVGQGGASWAGWGGRASERGQGGAGGAGRGGRAPGRANHERADSAKRQVGEHSWSAAGERRGEVGKGWAGERADELIDRGEGGRSACTAMSSERLLNERSADGLSGAGLGLAGRGGRAGATAGRPGGAGRGG